MGPRQRPLDILKAAYDAVLIRNEKAELSIRGGAEEDPRGGEYISNINLPGYWSVYYFGDTEEKPLGLVMYQADLALGDLAFGRGDSAWSLSRRIAGYHSLPEMFPGAYAKHPNSDSNCTTTRIFLDVSAVPQSLRDGPVAPDRPDPAYTRLLAADYVTKS